MRGVNPQADVESLELDPSVALEQIVKRCGFESTEKMYERLLAVSIRLHKGDAEAAHDSVQDLMLTIVQYPAKFKNADRGFLERCLVNDVREGLRKKQRVTSDSQLLLSEDVVDHRVVSPAITCQETNVALMRLAIDAIPDTDGQQTALLLTAEGHSHSEIAAIQGTNPKTVATRCLRGRVKVRQLMDEKWGDALLDSPEPDEWPRLVSRQTRINMIDEEDTFDEGNEELVALSH